MFLKHVEGLFVAEAWDSLVKLPVNVQVVALLSRPGGEVVSGRLSLCQGLEPWTFESFPRREGLPAL